VHKTERRWGKIEVNFGGEGYKVVFGGTFVIASTQFSKEGG
jgi:hypothetical protein